MHFTSREISEKHDRFARWYDFVEGVPDLLGVRKLRRRLLRHASGNVLEVAVGTGKNLPCYPPDCRIIAIDVSKGMLNVARQRAAKLSMDVSFLLADAEALPFSDKSLDTVVSSVTTCTFPNPVAALREMARVSRTDGRVLLLDYGRSDRQWLGRWQDRHAESPCARVGLPLEQGAVEACAGSGLKG